MTAAFSIRFVYVLIFKIKINGIKSSCESTTSCHVSSSTHSLWKQTPKYTLFRDSLTIDQSFCYLPLVGSGLFAVGAEPWWCSPCARPFVQLQQDAEGKTN